MYRMVVLADQNTYNFTHTSRLKAMEIIDTQGRADLYVICCPSFSLLSNLIN